MNMITTPSAVNVHLSRLVLGALIGFSLPAIADEERVIMDFDTPTSIQDWIAVNDGVMGGVSKGRFEWTDQQTLLFTGTLSLANNGGFASIRSTENTIDLSGASAISVTARGDGRTYWVGLRSSRQFGASSYRAYLPTEKGRLIKKKIPLSAFKLQAFGREISGAPIDPAAIVSIGFTLADKQSGPFRLEIDTIKAVFDANTKSSSDTDRTIVDVATAAGSFKTLLAAVAAADLTGNLAGNKPLTVFAPTDAAFEALPDEKLAHLLQPANRQKLANILKFHVVSGRVSLAQALEAKSFSTLHGDRLTAAFKAGRVQIGDANLIEADIEASNGVIHIIDAVLIPTPPAKTAKSSHELIQLAIDRGVPLFNNGNPAACRAVYEVTCEALLSIQSVSKDSRSDLSKALYKMRRADTEREKAWILRYALDRVLIREPETQSMPADQPTCN